VTDSDDTWAYDSLGIDDEGYVTGSAYTRDFCGGYDVTIGVSSYEYKSKDGVKMNHVPSVTIVNSDGAIVNEVHAHDSLHAEKAIENARQTAEMILDYPEQFLQ
jgi:hypothetical protein